MTKGLILEVPARCRQQQRGVLARWNKNAVMARSRWEHASDFLRARDLLAAPFLLRGRWTRWVSSRGRAPWGQGAFLRRRRQRCLRSCVARAGRRAMQREGRHMGAPCGADELGDASDPLVVEVVDRAVVQELTCQEQCGLRVRRGATSVGRRTSWGQ